MHYYIDKTDELREEMYEMAGKYERKIERIRECMETNTSIMWQIVCDTRTRTAHTHFGGCDHEVPR